MTSSIGSVPKKKKSCAKIMCVCVCVCVCVFHSWTVLLFSDGWLGECVLFKLDLALCPLYTNGSPYGIHSAQAMHEH